MVSMVTAGAVFSAVVSLRLALCFQPGKDGEE